MFIGQAKYSRPINILEPKNVSAMTESKWLMPARGLKLLENYTLQSTNN